jgi:hypothetical protein
VKYGREAHACHPAAHVQHAPRAQELEPPTAAQAQKDSPSWCRAAHPMSCGRIPAPAAGPVLIPGNSAGLVLQTQGDGVCVSEMQYV